MREALTLQLQAQEKGGVFGAEERKQRKVKQEVLDGGGDGRSVGGVGVGWR